VKTIKLAVKDTNGGVGYALGSLTVTSHDYPDGTPTSRDELVEGINGLGFGILKELVREFPDSNVVASPLSISLALGMTVNGARSMTRDEMLSVLGLAGHSVPGADEVYRELTELLTSLDPEVQFEVANSAWCQSGATFKQPFLDACRTYFNAEVRDVDFAGDPYGSPDSINAWVNDRTHGKIPEIVPTPGDPLTRLMLVDAIYFLGRWRKEFDPTYTRDGWFTLPNGSRQLCKMMKRPGPDPEPGHINLDDFEYYSEYSPYPNYDGFQMVDLAYGDSIFSMSIVLPYGRTTIDELISQLNTTQWNEWIADLDHCHGILTMPRFELRFAQDLKPALMALGMVTPFVPGTADFSGIADFALWISRVLHATYIKVNEAGTEAAAVTVVDITTGIPPDCAEFHMDVNRPFLFVIRENRANTILFMGRVAHLN
jgi:serpin B